MLKAVFGDVPIPLRQVRSKLQNLLDRTVWDVRSLSNTNYLLYCRVPVRAVDLADLLRFSRPRGLVS
jgi:hypothetical protein